MAHRGRGAVLEETRFLFPEVGEGDMKAVGSDTGKSVEHSHCFGLWRTAAGCHPPARWPLGMPYCRNLGDGLWEVRSGLMDGKIGRVLFCVAGGRMVLLHGFVKKTQKTPQRDLTLARKRMREVL